MPLLFLRLCLRLFFPPSFELLLAMSASLEVVVSARENSLSEVAVLISWCLLFMSLGDQLLQPDLHGPLVQ